MISRFTTVPIIIETSQKAILSENNSSGRDMTNKMYVNPRNNEPLIYRDKTYYGSGFGAAGFGVVKITQE